MMKISCTDTNETPTAIVTPLFLFVGCAKERLIHFALLTNKSFSFAPHTQKLSLCMDMDGKVSGDRGWEGRGCINHIYMVKSAKSATGFWTGIGRYGS